MSAGEADRGFPPWARARDRPAATPCGMMMMIIALLSARLRRGPGGAGRLSGCSPPAWRAPVRDRPRRGLRPWPDPLPAAIRRSKRPGPAAATKSRAPGLPRRSARSLDRDAEEPGGVAAGEPGRVREADHECAGLAGGPGFRGRRAGELPHVVAERGDHVVRPRPVGAEEG